MNNPYKLNISIVPIFVIVAIALGAFYLFKNGDSIFNFSGAPEIRRLEGFPTVINTEKILDKKRVLIKSQDELNAFLNEVDDSGYVTLKENINFDKEHLIAVSSGTFDEQGHTIKIRKLYFDKEKNVLLVSIRQVDPGDTCDVEMTKNLAVDVVAISKTDLNIEYERVKEVDECN